MVQGDPDYGTPQATCANCGRHIPATARFCPHCGQRADSTPGICPQCGTEIRASAAFCPGCGTAVESHAAQVAGIGARDQAGVEYMGFWIRLAASIIDSVILSIVQIILTSIGLAFISIFVGLIYGVLFIGLRGQTPGKMALRIIVVDEHGNVPGIRRAIIREIPGKFISTIFILLGYLWIIRDPRKRAWHDHMSGTFVIRKQRDPTRSL